jgi:hypothetical protein
MWDDEMSDNDNQLLAVLHDHYRDTFAIIRERERERDWLFLVLIAVLGALGVQIGYPAESGGIVEEVTAGPTKLAIGALPAAAALTTT